MAVSPLTGPMAAPPLRVGGNPVALPWLAPPSYQAQDPFGAYLLTLSSASLEVMARSGYPVVGDLPLGQVDVNRLASAAAPEGGALAAGLGRPGAGADPTALRLIPTVPAAEAGDAVPGAAGAPQAGAPAAGLAARAGRRASTPENPALPDLGQRLALGSWGLATDATAKYMGAGLLGQQAADGEQARASAAYLSILKDIPAVSGVPSSLGLAANTSNTPQGQRFGRTTGSPPSLRAPGLNRGEPPAFDLLI